MRSHTSSGRGSVSDHQRVQRHDRPPLAGEGRRVPLGAAQHDGGAHPPGVGQHDARFDPDRGRLLDDPHTPALDRCGEPARRRGQNQGLLTSRLDDGRRASTR